jgi:hypothetical protein
MKLRISTSKQLQYLAYYDYSQTCLRSDPVEIPDLFEDWIRGQTNESLKILLERYVEND